MRICHVTPHLPPDQAANALLPLHLGRWASHAGHEVMYVTHPPITGERSPVALPGPVTVLPRRSKRPALLRKAHSLVETRRISRAIEPVVLSADLIHVHSNGLLSETAALVAARRRKRVVMTLYGTEIWHYRPRRGVDLFTRAYRSASAVTFYSQALLTRAADLGLSHPRAEIIYPPVADDFHPVSTDERQRVRAELGLAPESPLLINVKRLHPLGGHRHLIDAMISVKQTVPDV
ncbi:MAG: glycosyltransferase family 4 protein, partial [Acidobacteria bacterium]|nr:glycosyltransferase family 4 protein [Acidobacteriota bacterium]